MKKTKRRKACEKLVDSKKLYRLDEAISLLKECPSVKFDQSVEISLRSGVDVRRSDQQVRGTVSLPNGIGKKIVVAAFVRADRVQEALDAGADFAGSEELCAKVQAGWTAFDAVIATPDMMREVGKLGKVLGPRGLMPTPKAGTVTNDLQKAITEVKAGRIEFKTDKSAVINQIVGKLSFEADKLIENVKALLQAIQRAKPATAKGDYIRSVVVSSTMGPGLRIDISSIGG